MRFLPGFYDVFDDMFDDGDWSTCDVKTIFASFENEFQILSENQCFLQIIYQRFT